MPSYYGRYLSMRCYLYMAIWDYMVPSLGVCSVPLRQFSPPMGGATQPVPMQLMGCTTWGHISHAKWLREVRTYQGPLGSPTKL